MDYLLTEEQQMLQDLARQIAEERIKPVRAELDEQETFPWDIIKDLAQADLCGTIIPEAYGGLGMGCMENVLVLEALAGLCRGSHHLRGQLPGRLSPPALWLRRPEAKVSAHPG